jgi:hypothetical protein
MSTPKVGFTPSFVLGAKFHQNAQNKKMKGKILS